MLVRNLPLFIFHVCIAGGACSEPELLELGMKGEYNRERLCKGVDNENRWGWLDRELQSHTLDRK